ncbi:MAG: V-type ATP synthase subunit E [Oscillospiraceae bacterium]|nr:V-type ATP synthase subunit E [Oscillospiraceae bacterium]
MANIQASEKYTAFENQVLEAAERQAAAIVMEAEKHRTEELRGVTKSFTAANFARRKDEMAREKRRCLSQGQQDYRKQLLLYREELSAQLFDKIKVRLNNFTSSEEYATFLTEKLKKHAQHTAVDGYPCVVFIAEKDEKYRELIKSVIPHGDIAVDHAIKIGGVKISNGHILYDETLDGALAAEQERFLSYCNLRIQ